MVLTANENEDYLIKILLRQTRRPEVKRKRSGRGGYLVVPLTKRLFCRRRTRAEGKNFAKATNLLDGGGGGGAF